MPICMYCCKTFKEEDLHPLRNDPDQDERLQYCNRCLPEVESNIRKTPWLNRSEPTESQREQARNFNEKFADIMKNAFKNR